MALDVFLCFNGNCREAMDFYSKIFGQPVKNVMTYGEMPEDPNYTIPEERKNLICYADMKLFGNTPMFCDTTPDMPVATGSNVTLCIGSKDKTELERIFNELKEGGEVAMELQSTFWSDLYGMVTDKFGVCWQVNLDSGKFQFE